MPKERTLTENVSPHGARVLMERSGAGAAGDGYLAEEGVRALGQIVYCELLANADLLSGWNCPSGWSRGKVLLAPFQHLGRKINLNSHVSRKDSVTRLAEKIGTALAGRGSRSLKSPHYAGRVTFRAFP